VIDELTAIGPFFGLSKGLIEIAVFARRTPEPDLCIARQRINQLLTKTADPTIQ
jgi:hypothetical protein